MPTPNAELLRDVLREVEYYPQWWDPKSIARRDSDDDDDEFPMTYYGVEGHAIQLTNPAALWHWQRDPDHEGAWFAVLVTLDGSRKKPGRNAAFVARQLLGLDREQAERLFGADTIEKLRQVVAELCEAAS